MDFAAILGIVTGSIGLINQLVPIIASIGGKSGSPVAVGPIVSNSLDLIGKIVPMIGGKNSAAIGEVIKTVTDMAPLITDQIGSTYTGVKNIIASLRKHPATLEEQLAALDAFDKQVDDAWNAIEGQIDPDAPQTAA